LRAWKLLDGGKPKHAFIRVDKVFKLKGTAQAISVGQEKSGYFDAYAAFFLQFENFVRVCSIQYQSKMDVSVELAN
jgi:hypothetical protein